MFAKLEPWTSCTASDGQPSYPASIPGTCRRREQQGKIRVLRTLGGKRRTPESDTSGENPSSRDREPVSAVKVVDAGDVPDENPG